MDKIQELYQNYAFMDSNEVGGRSEAECGATINGISTKYPLYRSAILERTYETPYNWYLLVFKPFNDSYERCLNWYLFKGIDQCRKKLGRCESYLMTREIDSTKVHVNAVACTSFDLTLYHNKNYCNKYKMHVQQLLSPFDREKAVDYIIKESSTRPWREYLDYIEYVR